MRTLLLLVFTFLAIQNTLTSQSDLEKQASIYLEESISFGEMAGVSGAIWKDGETLWKDGKGYLDVEKQLEADENMLSRTASISKSMTAIAILQLWEKGLLDLDDPVVKYLPSFPVKHNMITINHLLNHTSGIKAYKTSKEAFNTEQYNSLGDAMAVFQDRSLANTPGETYNYTTYGYVVLGAVMEAVSGQNYRAYMKQHIWEVAGMNRTDVEIFGQSYPNKAQLYAKKENGIFRDKQTNLSIKVPGGGIQSTVGDLLKFGEAVINHKLIKKETFEMMIVDGGKKTSGNPYGMGWFLYGKKGDPNGRIIGHSGSQAGASSQLMIYLDHNMVVATLANTLDAWNSVYSLNSKLAQLVIDPKLLEGPIRKSIPMDISVLNRNTGVYQAEDGKQVEVYRKGRSLYALMEGLDAFKLLASSETRYFARINQTEVEFLKDSKSMILTEGDLKSEYQKVSEKKSIARGLYNIMSDENSAEGKKWFTAKLADPNYSLDKETMSLVGYELIKAGELKEALDVFKLNSESFPNEKGLIDGEKMTSFGDQLLAYEYPELAFAYYEFNVEANPKSWKAHSAIGRAYQKVGKLKKAKKSLKKALELDPGNEELKSSLLDVENKSK